MPSAGEIVFVISADYARRTGGWIYDQRLLAGLARLGWRIRNLTLPAGFPNPSPEVRTSSAQAFAAIGDGSLVLVDQLCLGVLPEVAEAEGRRLRLVMIVHHPIALELAPSDPRKDGLYRCERDALRHVTATIVTSDTTAATLAADYAVPAAKIIVAVPGVDPQPLAHATSRATLGLLSVGAVIPRKNHRLLISALAGLRHLPWRLTIVGNTARTPAYVMALRSMIAARGLAARVRLMGELPSHRLSLLWSKANLYVAAARHEGYGMAISEAFAHGVPVITTRAGAVGQWAGRHGALLVPDDRVASMRAALRQVLADRAALARLRRDAMACRRLLPAWEATAATVDRELRRISPAGS